MRVNAKAKVTCYEHEDLRDLFMETLETERAIRRSYHEHKLEDDTFSELYQKVLTLGLKTLRAMRSADYIDFEEYSAKFDVLFRTEEFMRKTEETK